MAVTSVIVVPLLIIWIGLVGVLLVILRFLRWFLIVLVAAILVTLALSLTVVLALLVIASLAIAMAVMTVVTIVSLLLALARTLRSLLLPVTILTKFFLDLTFRNDAKGRQFVFFDFLDDDMLFVGSVLHGDDIREFISLEVIARCIGQTNGFGDDVERIHHVIPIWSMDHGAIFWESLLGFRISIIFKRQAADEFTAMSR